MEDFLDMCTIVTILWIVYWVLCLISKLKLIMDSIFHVSYEAARLLKEKGYSAFTNSVYREYNPLNTLFFKGESRDWNNMVSPYTAAPTKAEAIDWLESKGIVVELRYDNDELQKDDSEWEYYIYQYDNEGWLDETVSSWGMGMFYDTRLEAEDAAIIKALELL